MNLMHNDIRITDAIYAVLSKEEVQSRITALSGSAEAHEEMPGDLATLVKDLPPEKFASILTAIVEHYVRLERNLVPSTAVVGDCEGSKGQCRGSCVLHSKARCFLLSCDFDCSVSYQASLQSGPGYVRWLKNVRRDVHSSNARWQIVGCRRRSDIRVAKRGDRREYARKVKQSESLAEPHAVRQGTRGTDFGRSLFHVGPRSSGQGGKEAFHAKCR